MTGDSGRIGGGEEEVTRVLITVPDLSKKKLANGRVASVAVRSHWARRAEEKDIGTPTPDGESSIDPFIPVPFLLASLLFPHAITNVFPVSRHLFAYSVSPSFLLSFFLYAFWRFLQESSYAPYVSLTFCGVSFRVLLASVDFHDNFFPLFPFTYLSIFVSIFTFPSIFLYSIYLSADLSLSSPLLMVHFRSFSPSPSIQSGFLCKRLQVGLWHYYLLPRYFLSNLIPPKPAFSATLSFLFPITLTARYSTLTPLTPSQSSRQTVRYLDA